MSRGQQFPNANEPIAQGDGKITRPWFSVLNSLWSKASGGTVTAVTGSAPIASSGGTAPDISLNASGVSAGSYTNANITVTATGLVSAAANGSAGSGTVTTTGSPVSGNLTKFSGATSITNGDLSGDLSTAGGLTTTLANSGASAGTYGDSTNVAQVTVDAKGRVTAVSSVAIGGSGGGGVGGLLYLGEYVAAAGPNINCVTRNKSGFTGALFQADFDDYVIEIVNMVPVNGDSPQFLFSGDGGVTYDTGPNYFVQIGYAFSGGVGVVDQVSAQAFAWRPLTVTTLQANSAWNGSLRLRGPASTTLYKSMFGQIVWYDNPANLIEAQWNGLYKITTAVNAFRVNQASGANLTSGTVRVYGLAT